MKHWPLAATVIIVAALIAILAVRSIDTNDRHLVYLLDDAYIHMAMAKNFALHGVWGVTPYEFSSSSSSLLWTLLLAGCYWLFGVSEGASFVLNLLFAAAFLMTLYFILARLRLPQWFRFALMLWIAYVTPLPLLGFSGQEHLMHAFFSTLFVFLAVTKLSTSDGAPSHGSTVAMWIVAPLVVMARFEGLFLIAVIGLLFALRRKWGSALALVGLGTLPVVLYAVVSLSHGWSWLPNSVLLKGGLSNLIDPFLSADVSLGGKLETVVKFFIRWPYLKLLEAPALLVLTLSGLLFLIWRSMQGRRVNEPQQLWLIIFLVVTVLHLQFAQVGRFYRYEAYLIALGLIAIAAPAYELWGAVMRNGKRRVDSVLRIVAAGVLTIMAMAPLASRGGRATEVVTTASTNIYQQQYQMGRFINRFSDRQAVALNDIGAVNFIAEPRCFDLMGLASMPIFRERRRGELSPESIAQFSDSMGVRVAIVYDGWFEGGTQLPASWIRVGRWRISDNIVCGDEEVSFYAVDSSRVNVLAENMRLFADELPTEVIQSGIYLNDATDSR